MRAAALSALLAALLTAPLGAQAPVQNEMELANWWLDASVAFFPNYRGAGNAAGDGLFKVFPAEAIAERAGDLRISGYKITYEIDPAFQFTTGILARIPGVQFHRTKLETRGGVTFETIDLAQPIGPAYPSILVQLAAAGPWEHEVRFGPTAPAGPLRQVLVVPAANGAQRAGIAMLVLAQAGQRQGPNVPGITLNLSFEERHIAPGRTSYSGAVDTLAGTALHFGELGQPSARSELALGLRFDDATLQLFGSSAGGVQPDAQNQETLMGPGAYATDLASRGGFFGVYVQDQAHFAAGSPPTHFALPLIVATSLQGPTATLPVGGVGIRFAPGEELLATLLLEAGVFGPLELYRAGGTAGFAADQPGAFASRRVAVPADPRLFGIDLWIAALIVDGALQPAACTNAARFTLR